MAISSMQVADLTVEYRSRPLGMGEAKPRLGWKLISGERRAKQTAYRVIVSSTEELLGQDVGDLWDSGIVSSDRSVLVEYEGTPLLSRQRCFWKVKTWDARHRESVWSEPGYWSMGLLDSADYQASFIGHPASPEQGNAEAVMRQPAPYLRTEFELDRSPAHAMLYATAFGVYEARINGERAGNCVLAPGWTDYRKRIHMQAYEVTGLLKIGSNAIGVIAGTGWYAGQVGWYGPCQYGTQPWVLLQLEMTFEDGSVRTIASDGNWRTAFGRVLQADLQEGETHDARLELRGWDGPAFDDSGWQEAAVLSGEHPMPMPAVGPAAVIRETLSPRSVRQPEPGMYVYDMGQNMVGWVRLRIQGALPGTRIRLRFAETVNPDGTLYTENLRSAKQTDEYTAAGLAEETFEPLFTFHGFRYVELAGLADAPEKCELIGCVVYSDMPEAGSWSCSHPGVNQLQSNIVWGQKSNFLSVPTDCPQRNERMGWTGDAQIFARTASYNRLTAPFFTKWMDDVTDASFANGAFPDVAPNPHPASLNEGKPGWGDAGVIVPWTLYLMYGDKRIIERHYDAALSWLAFLEANSENGLRPDIGYGDWLSVGAETPKDVMATAYFAYSAKLASKIAAVLGKSEDALRCKALFEKVKSAFASAYVEADGRIKGDTQAVYTLALHMDLLPEQLRGAAAAHLAEDIERRGDHLTTGFLGVGYLLPVLTNNGRNDLSYRLLLQDRYPSWLYSVEHGATTIWERWDGWTAEKGFQTPDMNSFNHYSLGSVGEWLFRFAAGIDTDETEPGFRHIVIRPRPGDGISWVKATYESCYGTIRSEWTSEADAFELVVTVPANTQATVHITVKTGWILKESGIPADRHPDLEWSGDERDGETLYRIGSGTYRFRAAPELDAHSLLSRESIV